MSELADVQNALPSLKSLNDKLYEKRKLAALEIERWVRELWTAKNNVAIKTLISHLVNDFIHSAFPNARNGGLIGLAAVAIALGSDIGGFLSELVVPVLSAFADQDSRVRYYACESMYNIAKVAKSESLVYFNEIFDALSKLCTDVEVSVKNGAELLDRLVKDIVSEFPNFDVATFIPLLKERLQVNHPYARQFLVSWIVLLDSVPEINFITFLPEFLNDLFVFLSDSNTDIRTMTSKALSNLLEELKKLNPGAVKFQIICAEILRLHILSEDEETQHMALSWIKELNGTFPSEMVNLVSSLITHILPTLANVSEKIRLIAEQTNQQFYRMISEAEVSKIDFQPLVQSLIYLFLNGKESCRIACLDWLIMLHKKSPKDTFAPDGNVFPTLLKTLSDSSDEVIKRDLRLLSQIATVCDEEHFRGFLGTLLDLFRQDRRLLEARGGLIIRQLCVSLSGERIYINLASILELEKDLEFANLMVQSLTVILLTANELHDLRKKLRTLEKDENICIFGSLYKCWCHNAVSTLALCLLGEEYEHASEIVCTFSELQTTVGLLIQLDKLVQLLESPVFTYLRLHLLQPEIHPYLYKALYGILMILPQSSAFATLRNRLSSVSSISLLKFPMEKAHPAIIDAKIKKVSKVKDQEPLLVQFKSIQLQHENGSGK